MDIYAVVGNPVSHSKSPKIHSLFAAQTGRNIDYTAIQAPLDHFQNTVNDFFQSGGAGLNVTVPFKEQAWRLADERSDRAQVAGAVNTLSRSQGKLHGDNTDGTGLVRDLTENNQIAISNKKVLILGAGGAVRGVLLPLVQQQPELLVIANRTVAKAQQLAQMFADFGALQASRLDALTAPFDIVINGTSASLGGAVPAIPPSVISTTTVAYDMMYGTTTTAFNQWAKEQGACLTLDGLGMLVEQAAESFAIWHGVQPETQPVLDLLRRGS